MSTILRLRHLRNDSVSGAFEPLPSSFIRLKTGDSCSWSRIQTEMPRSAMERRKGMRQPHSSNLAVPMQDAAAQDDEQREEEAEGGRGLDEAR